MTLQQLEKEIERRAEEYVEETYPDRRTEFSKMVVQ